MAFLGLQPSCYPDLASGWVDNSLQLCYLIELEAKADIHTV